RRALRDKSFTGHRTVSVSPVTLVPCPCAPYAAAPRPAPPPSAEAASGERPVVWPRVPTGRPGRSRFVIYGPRIGPRVAIEPTQRLEESRLRARRSQVQVL